MVCCIADFQIRGVLGPAERTDWRMLTFPLSERPRLANAWPTCKSAIQQVWKPALRAAGVRKRETFAGRGQVAQTCGLLYRGFPNPQTVLFSGAYGWPTGSRQTIRILYARFLVPTRLLSDKPMAMDDKILGGFDA